MISTRYSLVKGKRIARSVLITKLIWMVSTLQGRTPHEAAPLTPLAVGLFLLTVNEPTRLWPPTFYCLSSEGCRRKEGTPITFHKTCDYTEKAMLSNLPIPSLSVKSSPTFAHHSFRSIQQWARHVDWISMAMRSDFFLILFFYQ